MTGRKASLKPRFNYRRIIRKSNKKQRTSKHFGWEMPLAKLSERVRSAGCGYTLWATSCPAPRKSRVTQRAGTRWASRVSHPGAEAHKKGRVLPSPSSTHTSFHLSLDTAARETQLPFSAHPKSPQ